MLELHALPPQEVSEGVPDTGFVRQAGAPMGTVHPTEAIILQIIRHYGKARANLHFPCGVGDTTRHFARENCETRLNYTIFVTLNVRVIPTAKRGSRNVPAHL